MLTILNHTPWDVETPVRFALPEGLDVPLHVLVGHGGWSRRGLLDGRWTPPHLLRPHHRIRIVLAPSLCDPQRFPVRRCARPGWPDASLVDWCEAVLWICAHEACHLTAWLTGARVTETLAEERRCEDHAAAVLSAWRAPRRRPHARY